ncbi:subtilisin-like protein [Hesseltinella vesiculosa]|uniref:Subtilisin-like protein n=1 Tax=Hesseltinella vesiculosa TaxID=101127 RepID=A0A1X2GXM2_9FUNG|nr:subtilisin-like protein [Hesseltinella vesiculosa]
MLVKGYLTLLSCLVLSTLGQAQVTSFSTSQSQKYIMVVDPATDLVNFLPNLLEGVFGLLGDLFEEIGDALHDLNGSHHKRTQAFEILDTFDLDNSFKAVSAKLEKGDFLHKIFEHFSEITDIVPDDKIQFNLPKPHHRLQTRAIEQKNHFSNSNHTSPRYANVTVPSILTQKNASWHLARVSQRSIHLNSPYYYPASSGTGVRVYVIDDGINKNHKDFNGRVIWGHSLIKDGDDNGGGHGTHVAGIIGGKTYGVAKNASLVSVRVLDKNGEGSVSDVLSGLQWAVKDAKKYKGKALINLSLGIDAIAPQANVLDKAATAAVKAGIPIFAAAGNSASDACRVVPAGNPNVYTVGSIDNTDTIDSLSCYGKCVSILAPGVNVLSDFIGSTSATALLSGTSMASPHVAGVGALLLPTLKTATPQALYDAITSLATRNKAHKLRSKTPNLILFNNATLTTQSSNSTNKRALTPKKKHPKTKPIAKYHGRFAQDPHHNDGQEFHGRVEQDPHHNDGQEFHGRVEQDPHHNDGQEFHGRVEQDPHHHNDGQEFHGRVEQDPHHHNDGQEFHGRVEQDPHHNDGQEYHGRSKKDPHHNDDEDYHGRSKHDPHPKIDKNFHGRVKHDPKHKKGKGGCKTDQKYHGRCAGDQDQEKFHGRCAGDQDQEKFHGRCAGDQDQEKFHGRCADDQDQEKFHGRSCGVGKGGQHHD